MKITKSRIPATSLVNHYLPADYTDAFECSPVYFDQITPDDVVVKFWTDFPFWVNALFKLRNFLVKFVGLKGDENRSIADFERCVREGTATGLASVPAKNENETVLLLSDKHLDAHLSIYFERRIDSIKVVAITLVHFHNRLGEIYFFFIKPFHSIIMNQMLKRAINDLESVRKSDGKG